MTLPAFTAFTLLAAIAGTRPAMYAADPTRMALIAVSAETAQERLTGQWWQDPRMLGAAILTAIDQESGFREDVHAGTLRGRAGELCLMQIHPRNPQWRSVGVPAFEALVGTDEQSTTWCIAAGTASLIYAANHCWVANYHTRWIPAMWSQYHLGHACWGSSHARKRTRLMLSIAGTDWQPTAEQVALIETIKEDEK